MVPIMEKLERMLAQWMEQKYQVPLLYPWWTFRLRWRTTCLMSWVLLTQIWKCQHLHPVLGVSNILKDTTDPTVFKRWGLPIHWLGAFNFCRGACPGWSCCSVFILASIPWVIWLTSCKF
jgi:hypothetical protein